jgi:ABC-type oligopeptide transport system substrate-binding subunit
VKWKRLVFADFIESLAREAPLAWKSGWAADYPDPDSFLRVCTWRQTAGWFNERYEQLVDQARRRSGTAERMAMYREAEQILIDEAAIVPLFYSRHHVLLKPWVKYYPLAPVGVLLLKNVLIEPH